MILLERIAFILVMKVLLVLIFVARSRQFTGLTPNQKPQALVSYDANQRQVTDSTYTIEPSESPENWQQIVKFDSGIVLLVSGSAVTSVEQIAGEVRL